MGAWNTVKNYIDRTLEMVNLGDKTIKYVGESILDYCDGKFQQTSCTTKRNIRKHTQRINVKHGSTLESVTEATVSKWLKSKGDKVIADEPLVELETDKVNVKCPHL